MRDLQDGEIMSATRVNVEPDTQRRQYTITLPDGHTVTGDWMAMDKCDRFVVQWCEAVRETWRERQQAKKRARTPTAPTPASEELTPETQTEPAEAPAPSSPEDLVKTQTRRLTKQLESNRRIAETAEKEIARIASELLKWEKVAHELGIDLEEKQEDDGSGRQPEESG